MSHLTTHSQSISGVVVTFLNVVAVVSDNLSPYPSDSRSIIEIKALTWSVITAAAVTLTTMFYFQSIDIIAQNRLRRQLRKIRNVCTQHQTPRQHWVLISLFFHEIFLIQCHALRQTRHVDTWLTGNY